MILSNTIQHCITYAILFHVTNIFSEAFTDPQIKNKKIFMQSAQHYSTFQFEQNPVRGEQLTSKNKQSFKSITAHQCSTHLGYLGSHITRLPGLSHHKTSTGLKIKTLNLPLQLPRLPECACIAPVKVRQIRP